MTRALFTGLLAGGALMISGACTMKDQPAPALTGPSELGLSIEVKANPSVLPLDGGSSAAIDIKAYDANGTPKPNVDLRISMRYGQFTVDYGRLSARSLVTNARGEASLSYTAPAVAPDSPDLRSEVSIVVTPTRTADGNYANTAERFVVIRLVPPGVVIPGDGLVARFTYTPSTPVEDDNIFFDASTSAANPLSPITTYAWDFGDGTTGNGRTAQHSYDDPGLYAVRLTVGDAYGRSHSVVQTISVAAGVNPNASFTFSPTTPLPGQAVHFNASSSTAASGRTITRYRWDFGDGSSDSGVQVSHTFANSGTYNVTLEVTDSAGRTDTQVTSVTIGADTPTASFTFSPTDPAPGQSVSFNASASSGTTGRTITSYRWDFGDGSGIVTTSSPTVSHTFGSENTFTVTLTVTDNAGRTATTTRPVSVKIPTQP